MGFCNCPIFFVFALICVRSSFAIISMVKRGGWFALFLFLESRDVCMAFPRGATGLSAVCGAGPGLLKQRKRKKTR